MMINNMDHTNTVSPAPPLTNCRQTATCSAKSDVILSRRRRTELRRLKVMSTGDDCVTRRKRLETDGDPAFPHHSSVIGRRREMEDAVNVELGFVNRGSGKFDFYGVYDGHGGSCVAYACRDRLHKLVAAEMEIGNGSTAAAEEEELKWEDLMVESFNKMDEEVTETDLLGSMGSTAVVAVVGDKEMVVANCGDSRAVLSRGGVAVPLSVDHKVVIIKEH